MSPEEVLSRTVLDCIAKIDMEDIEEVLAHMRSELLSPAELESGLWRLEACELPLYRSVVADLGHPPQESDWNLTGVYPKYEEGVDAA